MSAKDPRRRQELIAARTATLGAVSADEHEESAGPQPIHRYTSRLGNARLVPLGRIKPDPKNPRVHFDEARLAELAASIKAHGVRTPISLRIAPDQESFVIIAGERRYRAARLAALKEIPAVIDTDDRPDEEVRVLQLTENMHRVDLSPIEEAEVFRDLIEAGKTHEQLAAQLGKPRTTITEQLKLLELPPDLKERCRAAEMSRKTLLIEANRERDMDQRRRLIEGILDGSIPNRTALRAQRHTARSPVAAPAKQTIRTPSGAIVTIQLPHADATPGAFADALREALAEAVTANRQ